MAQKGKDFTGGLDNLIGGFVNSRPSTDTPAPDLPADAEQAQDSKPLKKKDAATSTRQTEEQPKKRGRGRPRKESTETEQRTTLILNADTLQEIKAISYRETGRTGRKVLIKDIIAEALQRYISDYGKERK